eukprot:Phypoly_transcript_04328.p1 GENE.Phypoly_transcript_04328~~Phypoly_transcript_04328.p1  ORF type:complete len:736 (+),score=97.57 Phypoly_transcript_04328:38-2209(+)
MTSIIKFTPISGAKSEDPSCYLLEVDDFCILLDCGWDDSFDVNLLGPLKDVAPRVDIVLLSHPDIGHLGALPYAMSKLGMNADVFGTIPLYKMGQMFMYDAYQSRINSEEFTLFDLDDVDACFEKFKQLKYSQHFSLTGKGAGIEITPYAAGHTIGGTVWKIVKETEEIVYAVDYNHKRERHLNGSVLETLTRPTLLITDAYNALVSQANRKDRDNELLNDMMHALRGGGNVLLPTDTAGRVLELLLCIDQYWTYNRLSNYSVALLNNVSYNTVEFAKSQLEWMSDTVMKSFDNSRENPFAFKYVNLCHTLEELDNLPKPIVVLASGSSLGPGFARDLFLRWASNPLNLVIFTDRGPTNTLAHTLLHNRPPVLDFTIGQRIPLDGEELHEHERKERDAKQKEDERKKAIHMEEQRKAWERDRVLSNKDDPYGDPFADKYDLSAARFAYLELANYPMYPCPEHKMEWDDYGESDEFLVKMALDANAPEKDSTTEQKEDEKIEPKIPTKVIHSRAVVEVRCGIKYIDFEGRSDGRSIKAILTHVAPRKLILVRGSQAAIDHLVQHAELTLKHTCKSVVVPNVAECVDLTSDTSIFKLRLKDTLLDNLDFAQVGDYELAYVDGRLIAPPQSSSGAVPMLDVYTQPDGAVPGHDAVYVGDVKLSDFRASFAKSNFNVQFDQGVLVCNNAVSLRKEEVDGSSRVYLEGVLGEDYYKVRDMLYQQYTIL